MADDRRRAEAEAARLRDQMRAALLTWLRDHGVSGDVGISGFVSPSGQPKMLINLDAQVAALLIEGITADKQPSAPPPQTPPPPPWAPEHPGWSVPPQVPPPHHSPPPPPGYGPDGWHGHRE